MKPTNIYEYLLQRHPYLPSILAVCGADEKYVRENASDFEKFRELCKIIVKLSGNDLYREISNSVFECFGEKFYLSRDISESLWRAYYGDGKIAQGESQTLNIRVVEEKILSRAISLGGMREFVKPDVYHVNLAREIIERGGMH